MPLETFSTVSYWNVIPPLEGASTLKELAWNPWTVRFSICASVLKFPMVTVDPGTAANVTGVAGFIEEAIEMLPQVPEFRQTTLPAAADVTALETFWPGFKVVVHETAGPGAPTAAAGDEDSAATVAVAAELAGVDPPASVAVTTERIVDPMSDAVRV